MKENIPGLPCYFVSKQGQVFRKDEYIDGRSGKVFQKRKGDWKELKISIHTNRKGKYPCPKVHVCVKNINRSLKVSRLVALAYIPNPENKPCVCHKDNNSLNNNVDNLYWGTQAENMSQMRLDKRDYRKVSIRAHRRVIRLKSLGWSSSRIGKRFKVNRTCINRILNKYEALLK